MACRADWLLTFPARVVYREGRLIDHALARQCQVDDAGAAILGCIPLEGVHLSTLVGRLAHEYRAAPAQVENDVREFVTNLNRRYLINIEVTRAATWCYWLQLLRHWLLRMPAPWYPVQRLDLKAGLLHTALQAFKAVPPLFWSMTAIGAVIVGVEMAWLGFAARLWFAGMSMFPAIILSWIAHELGHIMAIHILDAGANAYFLARHPCGMRTVHRQGTQACEALVGLAGPLLPTLLGVLLALGLHWTNATWWEFLALPFVLHTVNYLPGLGDGDLFWSVVGRVATHVRRRVWQVLRTILTPFMNGFVVVLLLVILGFPVLAIIADASGADSFRVGVGPLVVYRFEREGNATSVQLVPLGTFLLSIAGGVANMGLRSMITRLYRP